ncbi:hypothetical protein C5Y96_14950 [Blastopirellula marina]|uniref:Lipoprotein n=1 Tax=Blastopirellula marina TaxID=124 RepID=A0A2S8FFQ1_9BACT|nr:MULTISPECIES: hypothetical protein [Pirellulaceae]PQO30754.1 hypothetical protein C5Y96_14950 [Blastopirellula marina]RCS50891.1 hypothetical protein DTL36_14960 [Bremerella cremea]
MKTLSTTLFLSLILLSGCAPSTEGSQEGAEAYLSSELNKWIAGEDSEAETLLAATLRDPISFNIRNISPCKAHILAYDLSKPCPKDQKSWPGYRCNVVIEWISQANRPLEKVTVYTLTWSPVEKKWYVHEEL